MFYCIPLLTMFTYCVYCLDYSQSQVNLSQDLDIASTNGNNGGKKKKARDVAFDRPSHWANAKPKPKRSMDRNKQQRAQKSSSHQVKTSLIERRVKGFGVQVRIGQDNSI